MYYFQDRFEFKKSNKTLDLTSMEEITSFFQLLHQDCKNDSTLKEIEPEDFKRELRTKLNKEFSTAHKKQSKRAFSRERNSNGCGRGHYQPDERHKGEQKKHHCGKKRQARLASPDVHHNHTCVRIASCLGRLAKMPLGRSMAIVR